MKTNLSLPLKQQICERLKQARQASGFATAKEFALNKQLKISTYTLHEAGTRAMSFEIIEHYCQLLKIDLNWLLTGQGDLPSQKNSMVPIIEWNEVLQFPSQLTLTEKKWTTIDIDLGGASFALRVQDNALEPRYPIETLLLVDLSMVPQSHDFAILVLPDQQVLCRQILLIKQRWWMRALYPEQSPEKITADTRVLGKVIQAKLKC